MPTILGNYFSKWRNVIDLNELQRLMPIIINLYNRRIVSPDIDDIFKVFSLCNYDKLKCVMLGMDPYPQKGVATGVAFANKPGTLNISPSLEILKEAAVDYTVPHGNIDFDITLERWCEQGVLMLNSALTVEVGRPRSHLGLWRQFVSSLLRNLTICQPGLVYILFGQTAQTFTHYIDNTQNLIIRANHPAFLARENKTLDSNIFRDVNRFIDMHNGEPIEWFTETY